MFSVVLPCFNEARHGYLPEILENLSTQEGEKQIIAAISDSADDTLSIVQQFPDVEIIQTDASNRAQRLNAGIDASCGEWVLLHHPATLLPKKTALVAAQRALADAVWGGFTHSFDWDTWLLRFTSWYSNEVRSRSGILYLDHCIFARRAALIEIGGVPDMDIFEDTALSLALKRLSIPVVVEEKVVTSARRFRDRGLYRQAALNQLLKMMYHANLDPQRLNWLYERKSQINVGYEESAE